MKTNLVVQILIGAAVLAAFVPVQAQRIVRPVVVPAPRVAPVAPVVRAATAVAAVAAAAATAPPAVAQRGPAVRVTVGSLNIRRAPNPRAGVVGVVPRGTILRVRGSQRGWLNIVDPRGRVGWVSSAHTARVR